MIKDEGKKKGVQTRDGNIKDYFCGGLYDAVLLSGGRIDIQMYR